MPYPKEIKEKIAEIAKQIVLGMIEQGKLDPKDGEAIKAATKQAVRDAKATYHAVQDFLK